VRLQSSKKTLLQVIRSWEEQSLGIIDFIRERRTTRYVLVTIPEALGVRLTERVIRELGENGIEVGDLIINHIVKESDCEFHRKRQEMQHRYIRSLEETCAGINIVKLYLSPYEIKGVERIREIGKSLFA
jgi:arsenite-transporting ATPase